MKEIKNIALQSKLALARRKLSEKTRSTPELSAIPVRGKTDSLAPSYAQQRMWFLDQFEPNSSYLNVGSAFRIDGLVDLKRLERAFAQLVERHDSLRSRFSNVEGAPVMQLDGALPVSISIGDLSAVPPENREVTLSQELQKEATAAFDLSLSPLWRVKIWRLAENQQVIQFTFHHIITDGWSRSIFYRELTILYNNEFRGITGPLPELPINYSDYVAWQREELKNGELVKQLGYWKAQLAGELTPLELPSDRPRPATPSYQGAVIRFSLPTRVTPLFKNICQQQGATPYMLLLTAFMVLLFRYTNQRKLFVGTPIAGRTRPELESLVGLFINTLVLRADLGGEPSFLELLEQVKETALAAYANQDLPIEKLVETLQPERDPSRNPLFQVMFAMRNMPGESLDLAETKTTTVVLQREKEHFDLSLSMWESAGGIHGYFEYATDLFNADRIERMATHYRCLLDGIAADPECSINRLPLMSNAERRQLLEGWNETTTDYPEAATLQALFESQVAHTPDAIAVVFQEQCLSYAELNRQANQLAHALIGQGVGAETLVGLCMERSPQLLIGLLGILKAGGAYVPLDPTYPAERLSFMLEDSAAPILLTQSHLLPVLPPCSGTIICLDDSAAPIWAGQPETNPAPRSGPDERVYVIYTSGSTGRPKGVEVLQRGVVNHSLWVSELFQLQAADRVLQMASISFDIAVEEIFPTLIRGSTLVLYPETQGGSIAQFNEVIQKNHVTVVDLATAVWHEWVWDLERGGPQPPGGLRLCVVGGETASPEALAKWWAHVGERIRWINGYGPTETSVAATEWIVETAGDIASARYTVPIGKPEANLQCYVLDPVLEPVPVGVPGELYIGGMGVARGYLNRPELTANSFIPNPFSADPADRIYKTGDRVRYKADGNIEFLGRIDYQIKLRGFRIELGEIESALQQHSEVQEAIVTVWEHNPGDKRLVAYLVPAKEAITIVALREFLRTKLPEYMLPSLFVMLEHLPLLPNGKLDRSALPAPETNRDTLSVGYTAPRTSIEKRLAAIWSDVLGVERVGVDDNFFDLGGHSLLATRVVSRINGAFGIDFPLSQLFESPRIEALAEKVAYAPQTGIRPALSPIKPVSRTARQGKVLMANSARADGNKETNRNKDSS